MATTSAPPSEPFRLSQLINDTRYRGATIQIVALILLMLTFAWLVDNTIQNLEALGKDFNFSFLWTSAGYDVNQRLIEYDSQSSHARAAMLGILNTLILAVVGCVTATVIGVFVGVLRLSNNWIVSRLMTVFIEVMRNVPVLIWILIVVAVVNESLPTPRSFKGEETGAFVLTNRGAYFPEPLFTNSLGDIDVGGLFLVSNDFLMFVAVLGLSIWGAGKMSEWATKRQNETGVRPQILLPQLALIVLPTAILLFSLGFYLGYAELKGFNFKGGTFVRDSFIGLWIALSLYTGAFIAENVRAGVQAVSRGQSEASAALGVTPGRTMSLVVLPQALRIIIPPLISQYLNLTKNTSLAIAVGYMDATGTLGGITLNQTGREMECLLLLMAFYLVVSLSVSGVLNWYNERVKLKER
ncbi:MAG: ABC transporter permease subunit [Rhodobacteraceae bacterium]|nr:ABC transporter permease subunit [Paracoccaceae bacterium]